MIFTRLTVLFIFIFTLLPSLSAQMVQVDDVKNRVLRNGWLQCNIALNTSTNTDPKALNPNFVEDISVSLYLGFKNDKIKGGYDFYTSSLSILILEKGDKNIVSFYLPSKIMKMHKYSTPTFYFVDVVVGKQAQKYDQSAFSRNFSSKESINTFINKANSGSPQNKGRLIPCYLAPVSFQAFNEELTPVFYRSEPDQ